VAAAQGGGVASVVGGGSGMADEVSDSGGWG